MNLNIQTPPPQSDLDIPRWPVRLQSLANSLRMHISDESRREQRGETWVLLHTALLRYLKGHSRNYNAITNEDIQEIATEKSLDLLLRIESGKWSLVDRHPLEITRYLSRVAWNSLSNLCEKSKRFVRCIDPEYDAPQTRYFLRGEEMTSNETPEIQLDQKRFASSLRCCFNELAPRLKKIWLFRVFGNMPSKVIAAHPDVALKASHVDVLLQRTRQSIRQCLARKGLESSDFPPGTFSELLRVFFADIEELKKVQAKNA